MNNTLSKCRFCENDVESNFCSNCGKRNLRICDRDLFGEMQEFVHKHNQGEDLMSKQIKQHIESLGDLTTPSGFYAIFVKLGYMFRVAEEKFGNFEKGIDENIDLMFKEQGLSQGEILKKVTNYLDSKLDIDTIGIKGLDQRYLVIKEAESWFNDYIGTNVTIILQRIKSGKYLFRIGSKDQEDYLGEMFFRQSAWGYLYRLAEGLKK